MHYYGADGRQVFEHVACVAVVVDEVLADDLEPVHFRVMIHQVGEVLVAQTDPQAEVWKTSSWGSARAYLYIRPLHHVEGGKARRNSLSLGLSGIGCSRYVSTLT